MAWSPAASPACGSPSSSGAVDPQPSRPLHLPAGTLPSTFSRAVSAAWKRSTSERANASPAAHATKTRMASCVRFATARASGRRHSVRRSPSNSVDASTRTRLRAGDRIGQLVGVQNRAAAGGAAHDVVTQSATARQVDVGQRLVAAQGNAGGLPLVETQGRRHVAAARVRGDGFVDRHVPDAGSGRSSQQAPCAHG